ncbi:hypothetical protein ACB092_05G163100 [Castanea dentata]
MLPPTHMPMPYLPLLHFVSPLALHVSLALHNLPLDSALSNFLSAVLPCHINCADIKDSDATTPTLCFCETRLLQRMQ